MFDIVKILKKSPHSGRLPRSYHSGISTAVYNISNTARLCSPSYALTDSAKCDRHPPHIETDFFKKRRFTYKLNIPL